MGASFVPSFWISLRIPHKKLAMTDGSVLTLLNRAIYFFANIPAISVSSWRPSTTGVTGRLLLANLLISAQKLRLVSHIKVSAIFDLRKDCCSKRSCLTARWYLARVFLIMFARAPVGGRPADFHTLCQNKEVSRNGRTRSFHMGNLPLGGERMGNVRSLALIYISIKALHRLSKLKICSGLRHK